MKKIALLFCAALVVFASLVTPAASADSNAAMEAYKAVLRNEMTFYSTDNEKHYKLKDFDYWDDTSSHKLKASHFAVVDMDADGIPEVVLKLSTGFDGSFEVLHYENGTVYGFNFVFRGLLSLSKDGMYFGSSGASDNSVLKASSIKDTYKAEEAAHSKSGLDSNGAFTVSYYIGKSKVTEDQYYAFCENVYDNPAVWHEYNEANIASAFNFPDDAISEQNSAEVAPAPSAGDNYVRLAIKGTNVNLRPQPLAAGRVTAQMSTGDVFIAEKKPVFNEYANSTWYKIVLAADAETGKISVLSEWDSRFKANVAFVHVDYATAAPLAEGDMEKIKATPVGGSAISTSSGSITGYWAFISYSDGNAYLSGYYFAEDGTGLDFSIDTFEITSYAYADGNLSYTQSISEELAEHEGYAPGLRTFDYPARLLSENHLAIEGAVYNRMLKIEPSGWASYSATQLDGSVFVLGEGRLVDAR